MNEDSFAKNIRTFTLEHRAKLSLAKKGKAPWNKGKSCPWASDNFDRTLPAWNKGTIGVMKPNQTSFKKGSKLSQEIKSKISNSNMGRIVSDETRRKIGEKNRGRKFSEEYLETIRGVLSPSWMGGVTTETIKEKYQRRKNRIEENGGFHSKGEWDTLKAQYNFTCPCCKKSEPEIKLTKDHIISVIKGGSDNIENIQPLCGRCNSIKQSKCIKY